MGDIVWYASDVMATTTKKIPHFCGMTKIISHWLSLRPKCNTICIIEMKINFFCWYKKKISWHLWNSSNLLTFLLFPLFLFNFQVSWFQNSFPLQPTDRRTMTSRGNKHTLQIRHVQPEDFGNYRQVFFRLRPCEWKTNKFSFCLFFFLSQLCGR